MWVKAAFASLATFWLATGFAEPSKIVVVRASSADLNDYEAYVQSASEFEYPSQYLLRLMPSPQARERLAELFSRAQQSYLNGSSQAAQEAFKRVVALANEEQWSEAEQTVLLHCYLRLAQLENDAATADSWLHQAVQKAHLGKPSPEYFPPPLLERLASFRKKSLAAKAAPPCRYPDFKFLVLNGETIDLQKTDWIEIPTGSLRATCLSDVYRPVAVFPAADFAHFRPPKQPLLTGGCSNPKIQWQGPGHPESLKGFFTLECALGKSNQNINVAFRPDVQDNSLALGTKPPPSSDDQSTPFYRKKWFWIAVGAGVAVTTGILLVQSSKTSSSAGQPTSADGF